MRDLLLRITKNRIGDIEDRTDAERYFVENADALKVVLGKGEGKNWWYVMFPPLCVSTADGDELPADEYRFMQSGGRRGIR